MRLIMLELLLISAGIIAAIVLFKNKQKKDKASNGEGRGGNVDDNDDDSFTYPQ